MKSIPPHIGWPLAIVGLLLLGVAWTSGVVVASLSDGGAQVVDNYYERATNWDEEAALRKQSEALGWQVIVDLDVAPSPAVVSFSILDRDGAPVTGLSGVVRAFRPQQSMPVAVLEITDAADRQSAYRLEMQGAEPGLWDFEVDVYRDSLRFLKTVRKEFSY